jgi:hypothetical protein
MVTVVTSALGVVPRARTVSSFGAVAAVFTALGCADFETPVDPTGGAPDTLVETPSFSANVAPIFDKRCAVGGCHTIATHQAGLVLEPSEAYQSLVGVSSTLRPSLERVTPGEPTQSWLVTMISADDVARQGVSRMPLATYPLTDNQIATIVRWIEQGALRN